MRLARVLARGHVFQLEKGWTFHDAKLRGIAFPIPWGLIPSGIHRMETLAEREQSELRFVGNSLPAGERSRRGIQFKQTVVVPSKRLERLIRLPHDALSETNLAVQRLYPRGWSRPLWIAPTFARATFPGNLSWSLSPAAMSYHCRIESGDNGVVVAIGCYPHVAKVAGFGRDSV